jgi:diguanylate cyclase
MAEAPLHPDEARRLAAVARTGLVRTPPEERFDRLTRLAASFLGAPTALLTFVGEDRQWAKSLFGSDLVDIAREDAFCAHAIGGTDDLMVVEDTAADPRFAENPLVTGAPGIRFYAGHVVHGPSGHPLGALCVLDDRPRTLSDQEAVVLADLAALAEVEIAAERAKVLVTELDASEERKELALHTLNEGIVVNAGDGRIVEWNPAAERLLGLSGNEIVGLGASDLEWRAVHEDGTPWPNESHPAMACLVTRAAVGPVVMGIHRPDGSLVWLEVTSRPGALAGGVAAVTVFIDVTERRRLADALARSERASRLSLDALEQAVIMARPDGSVVRMNPAAERITGYRADELTALWQGGGWQVYDEQWEPLSTERRPLLRAFAGDVVRDELLGWIRKDGRRLLLRMTCVADIDGDGSLLIAFTDITEERRLQREQEALTEQLAHLAAHDPLTDLANRSVLVPRLWQSLARAEREGQLIGLCFIDLDDFKAVNDTLGHAAGDSVIVEVADRIRTATRVSDVAVRIGGDEFVVVLDPVDGDDDAAAVTERLRQALTQPPVVREGLVVGASIGLAVSTPGEDPASLMSRADAALYTAKRTRPR